MPVIDEFLIVFQIRCVDPFFYFDLTEVCFWTFMDLENIFETTVFIKSSQWKQSSESRSYSMDAAASFSVEKYALVLYSGHAKVRKDVAVRYSEFQTFL